MKPNSNMISYRCLIAFVALTAFILADSTALASIRYVDDDDPTCGGQSPCYSDIQTAVDASANGDTIMILDGMYTSPVNVEGFAGLVIMGTGVSQVTVQPSATIDWGGTYGSTWQVGIRIYDSTDVSLSHMTFDFSLIRNDNVAGMIYYESSGIVENSVLRNMSIPDTGSVGELEITLYLEAQTYLHEFPAQITIRNNTFEDTGRLGIGAVKNVNALVEENEFVKTAGDYGYAIDMSAESSGTILNNTISGYAAPSQITGMPSCGINVTNANCTNTVQRFQEIFLERNDIFDCDWGVYIGNTIDGIGGDVDIYVEGYENEIHDNLSGGVYITDEDASIGSSVYINFYTNILVDNIAGGNGAGYYIETQGDGNITAYVENDIINGHDTGVYVTESVTGSTYDIQVQYSDLSDSTIGVENCVSGLLVNASGNWWGYRNPHDVEDQVIGDVDYTPWVHHGNDLSSDPGFQPRLNNLHVDDNSPQFGTVTRIQEGVNKCDNGTVSVEAGTYVEDIAVHKSVTISGAGTGSTFLQPVGNQLDFYYNSKTHMLVYADGVTIQNLHFIGDSAICDSAIIVEDTNGSEPVPISNITLEYCEIHHYGYEAIAFVSENDTFTNLSVFTNILYLNNMDQVLLLGDCDTVLIQCNEIFDSPGTGIHLMRPSGTSSNTNVVINFNNLFDNDTAALIVDSSAHSIVLDAQYNWWGEEDGPNGDGPGSGDAVYGWVDFDPWFQEEQTQPCPPPPLPTLDPVSIVILLGILSLAFAWKGRMGSSLKRQK